MLWFDSIQVLVSILTLIQWTTLSLVYKPCLGSLFHTYWWCLNSNYAAIKYVILCHLRPITRWIRWTPRISAIARVWAISSIAAIIICVCISWWCCSFSSLFFSALSCCYFPFSLSVFSSTALFKITPISLNVILACFAISCMFLPYLDYKDLVQLSLSYRLVIIDTFFWYYI